ncbi:hypothetical protein N182_38175 [Sinorhizobium sp. GL2]|nr:hypothetical protein N182_38175 [Sinorhizobium sp. GL2]
MHEIEAVEGLHFAHHYGPIFMSRHAIYASD